MKSVLITGGSGFLGHGLVAELLKWTGIERICVLSRGEFRQFQMRQEFTDDRMRWFIGDVRDRTRLERAMEGCEVVIHAAALKRVEVGEYSADEMVRTNVMGSLNVIEAAHTAKVDRVVFVSSDKAYAPINAYGASKLMAEKLFLSGSYERGARRPLLAVCRYGNVAGSTGSVIPIWREQAERGIRSALTNPYVTRFWMTRKQAVDLVLDTARNMRAGNKTFLICRRINWAIWLRLCALITSRPDSARAKRCTNQWTKTGAAIDARRMSVHELRTALREI